jgi:hypothetical protein
MIWDCLYLVNVLIDTRLNAKYRIYIEMKQKMLGAMKKKQENYLDVEEQPKEKEVVKGEEIKEKEEVAV